MALKRKPNDLSVSLPICFRKKKKQETKGSRKALSFFDRNTQDPTNSTSNKDTIQNPKTNPYLANSSNTSRTCQGWVLTKMQPFD